MQVAEEAAADHLAAVAVAVLAEAGAAQGEVARARVVLRAAAGIAVAAPPSVAAPIGRLTEQVDPRVWAVARSKVAKRSEKC